MGHNVFFPSYELLLILLNYNKQYHVIQIPKFLPSMHAYEKW